MKQRAEDVLPTNHPDFHLAALHITSTRREELLPVFPPRWKELDVIRMLLVFFLNKNGKKRVKSFALALGVMTVFFREVTSSFFH